MGLPCFIMSCLCVGMATCCFFSLQDLLPPLGRWWTRPPRTRLHQYHLSHHPPLHPPLSLVQSRHPRSRRMRLISTWPNRMAKSTGTKIPSCKSQEILKHQSRVRHLMLCLLLQMSPRHPWKMCALCTIRGKIILPFFVFFNVLSFLTGGIFYFNSLLMKTTWITLTRQWSTCHSTRIFASWPVELTS